MATETISKKLFTVDEFYRMSDAGILPPDGRFELIRGEIIEMPLPESPHSGSVNRLNHLFVSRFAETVVVSVQNPVFLNRYSMPIPDLALLKPRPDFYTDSHPTPGDILLVVEVAHTSVWYDANIKSGLYAEFGIPEYWLVDIRKDSLVVHSEPIERQYKRVETRQRGQTLKHGMFPAVSFTVDQLLGSETAS
jgi:Uma2 family endonuclease